MGWPNLAIDLIFPEKLNVILAFAHLVHEVGVIVILVGKLFMNLSGFGDIVSCLVDFICIHRLDGPFMN